MKRKVLFLIESLGGGGAEKVLTTLVQHIDKDKFDVTVCVISGDGIYEKTVKECSNYYAILHNPQKDNLISNLLYKIKHHLVYKWLPLSLVYKMFVPKNSDVEIAFVEGFTTKLLSHSSNKTATKIAWVHCNFDIHHWTKTIFDNDKREVEAYNSYNKIVFVSKTAENGYKQTLPDVATPTSVIYNAIDSDLIRSMASETIDSHGVLRMVSVGRLAKVKAFDRLVRITKQLRDEQIDVDLWIVGDGSERQNLEKLISDNGLFENVKLLGFQSNPYKYLSQCDLFVCSSLSEGYSTAVTEALVLGLPVVTTNCAGMDELLKGGQCGIITDNDETALYKGIKSLLTDKSQFNKMKSQAIQRGQDFDLQSLMTQIQNILK